MVTQFLCRGRLLPQWLRWFHHLDAYGSVRDAVIVVDEVEDASVCISGVTWFVDHLQVRSWLGYLLVRRHYLFC